MIKTLRFSLIGVLALCSVLATSQQTPPSQATVTISVSSGYYASLSFSPGSVTIAQGGKVTWVNQSSVSVNLASSQAGFQRTLGPQGSFEFTFQTVGAYLVTGSTSSASSSMTVTVLAGGSQAEPVQEYALVHSLNRLAIFPNVLVVRKAIKVRLFNIALDGSHGRIEIRDPQTGQAVFNVTGNFSAQAGAISVAEFIPDKTGEFQISHLPHGHNITGKLIVVETYPEVLKKLKELGQFDLTLIHSLSDLKVFPAQVVVFKDLKVRLFNIAKDGVHDPIVIRDAQTRQLLTLTVNGESNKTGFRAAPGELTMVEFAPDKAGEFEISHEPHGHPITGKLIVKEEK